MASERHHYLPQFYLKGFLADNGKFWVYDKVSDLVLPDCKSPKQFFFEWDANSVKVGDVESDFIESTLSFADSLIAKTFLQTRDTRDIDSIEDVIHVSYLTILITFLYWRSPANRTKHRSLIESYRNSKSSWLGFNGINSCLAEFDAETQGKIERSWVPIELLKEGDKSEGKRPFKILDTKNFFLVSDSPILFKNDPTTAGDFMRSVIFPISKSRIFLGLEGFNYSLTDLDIHRINLLMIRNAGKYIACHDKGLLERYVYRFRNGIRDLSETEIFETQVNLFNDINTRDGTSKT